MYGSMSLFSYKRQLLHNYQLWLSQNLIQTLQQGIETVFNVPTHHIDIYCLLLLHTPWFTWGSHLLVMQMCMPMSKYKSMVASLSMKMHIYSGFLFPLASCFHVHLHLMGYPKPLCLSTPVSTEFLIFPNSLIL